MGKRILIIDDDEAFCEIIENLLSGAGYEVEVVHLPIIGAGDALSADYDLITLDLEMPDATGAELAELFKDQALKVPVVVISGYLNDDIIEHLRGVGIRHTLPKPFRREALLRTVEQALAGNDATA